MSNEWTTAAPTITGYYWYRDPAQEPRMERIGVDEVTGELGVLGEDQDGYPWNMELKFYKGQWAGPILPPA